MANPAPTINQINAFNATQGTTIDFNIIGGTELVRSNKIYIYDLSDNSLICTHLYVSTESIHELPANTDSSIVYESGKSSADFVNGAQYYAQIQTYTDTAGTQGGSGLSVAKMFWCLVDPTLTITTIPSTISTTSYNVSATYTDTSASVVSNIIQQYQFNLYSAIGSLLQSSGVVVGSGTQQGTSDVYDISYNFTGLNVGSSYYVTVEVTTTQGMNVIAQSGTFTVSIDTPTLGEATVVNNACDGYISVTSNLSGEYGGSASGEIASFVTNSVNNISSLKVTLEPIQDLHGYDAPWVGGSHYNQWDEEWENGSIDNSGQNIAYAANMRSKNYISIQPSTTYSFTPNSSLVFFWYDSNKDFISSVSAGNTPKTSPSNAYYLRFRTTDGYGGTYKNDISINYPSTVTTYSPYSNICPISGWNSVEVIDDPTYGGFINFNQLAGNTMRTSQTRNHVQYTPNNDGTFTLNGTADATDFWIVTPFPNANATVVGHKYYIADANKNGSATTFGLGFGNGTIRAYGDVGAIMTSASSSSVITYAYNAGAVINNAIIKPMLIDLTEMFGAGNEPSTVDEFKAIFPNDYYAYNSGTKTNASAVNGTPYLDYTTSLGTTVYGGTLDVVSGELTVDKALVTLQGEVYSTAKPSFSEVSQTQTLDGNVYVAYMPLNSVWNMKQNNTAICDRYEFVDLPPASMTFGQFDGRGSYFRFVIADQTLDTLAKWNTYLANNPMQLVYELATPTTIQLTPTQVQTLLGQNNVWSEQQGEIELSYHIPITNLLVKRQDVDDVSGNWLTLYSQPITQASDMDFTFIDFLNQYGKTYKYALVPLLTQQQSGVEVEVEGGYTVSDEVQSIFDGVFIADSTGSQKCKANVGYGNVDMNQVVGSITPIGAKYPIVITNSQNQYHNGSISGTIVPDDYYFNGNLSRIDMVNKRDELEQFLTNKRAKIIKDWNGNIWLVMIMDNVSCTFNNSYGMGIVNFSTSWVEVGDPTNQQDLQATGLINVGGV